MKIKNTADQNKMTHGISIFKLLLIFQVLQFFCVNLYSQERCFITLWDTTQTPDTIHINNEVETFSTNTQIYFPGIGTKYTIEWQEQDDPTHSATLTEVTTTEANPILIDFGKPGTYIVKVHPKGFNQIEVRCHTFYYGDGHKFREVQQWGDVDWKTMYHAFNGCADLVFTAKDTPNLKAVKDASYMFFDCRNFNSDISDWDVGSITKMKKMFEECCMFNQDLSKWNVENVEDMYEMFRNCKQFEGGDLNNWNVGKVKDFGWTFQNCTSFNGKVSDWDVSSAKEMWGMFEGCTAFNCDIGSWDVSNAKIIGALLKDCISFNQDLSAWRPKKAIIMKHMFKDCKLFNQDLSDWDISSAENMIGMFEGCTSFNGKLTNFSPSKAIKLTSMFRDCVAFNQDLDKWDVGQVESFSSMFEGCSSFNGNVSTWNVAKATDMGFMFKGCTAFNQDLSQWNVAQAKGLFHMFSGCSKFNSNISNWNLANAISLSFMFEDCISFNQDLSQWNISNVTNLGGMFNGCSLFNQDLSTWDISKAKFMRYMLSNSGMSCANYNITLDGWANNTSVIKKNIKLDVEGLVYGDLGKKARQKLIEDKGWQILGDTYDADCSTAMAVDETISSEVFDFSPNPTSGLLTIHLSNNITKLEVAVFNQNGQIMQIPQIIKNNKKVELDVSALNPGVYLVCIGETIQRLIKV